MFNEKIIFFMPSLNIGGGNKVFLYLAKELLCRGFSCEIILPANTTRPFQDKNLLSLIPIVTVGVKNQGHLIGKIINILKAVWFIRNKRRDSILLVSDPILCFFISFFHNRAKYRFIQSDDYNLFNNHVFFKKWKVGVYKLLQKFSLRQRNFYLFNSLFTYQAFLKYSKNKSVSYRLLYPALDLKILTNLNTRNQKKLSLCTVGRPHLIKGFIDIVKLWQKIQDSQLKGFIQKFYVITDDDLCGFNLKGFQIVKASNDWELSTIYNKSDIFISTSRHEGFGMPGLESMACGCALITSKSAGVNEYAEHSKNCLQYDAGDVDDLYKCLEKMVLNKPLRQKLAERGEWTAQKFTWSNSANQLVEYFLQDGVIK